VTVETRRGCRSAFPTTRIAARSRAIASVDEVWSDSELLLKVKEPIEPSTAAAPRGLVLFTYLHIAADEPLTRALVDSGDHGCRVRDGRDRRPAAFRCSRR
jgi:alanine dehydrogenase